MKSVEIYNGSLVAGTWIISEGFKRVHYKILALCRKYESELLELADSNQLPNELTSRTIKRKKGGKGGKPVTEYLLNEAQTIFLGSMFRAKSGNDPVLRFKVQLAKDFVKLKETLANITAQQHKPEWIEKRNRGKIARLEETNTIKRFVQYCTDNGSKNAETYYCNITKMVNTTMYEFEGSFRNLRDVMTTQQLDDTYFHDNIVRRALNEGMKAGMDYHDIYQMVKDRIMSLADMLGKTEIVSKQLSMF